MVTVVKRVCVALMLASVLSSAYGEESALEYEARMKKMHYITEKIVETDITPVLKSEFDAQKIYLKNLDEYKKNINNLHATFENGEKLNELCKNTLLKNNIDISNGALEQCIYHAKGAEAIVFWQADKEITARAKEMKEEERVAAVKNEERIKLRKAQQQQATVDAIIRNRPRDPKQYTNLYFCYDTYNTGIGQSLAVTLAQVASSTPYGFANMLTSGASSQYCKAAYGTPSLESIKNAQPVVVNGSTIYWVSNKGQASLGFTSRR